MSEPAVFIADSDFTLWHGEALDTLRLLPSESVDCCVSSPPYYALRDYGTGMWEGGDPECDHARRADPKVDTSTLSGGKASTGHQKEGYRNACGRCGATRIDKQIGLEAHPDLYVERLVEVFDEVRRVLRPHGTLWLNIGDSYAQAGGVGEQGKTSQRGGRSNVEAQKKNAPMRPPDGIKAKDLIGVPWMLAFALRNAGWWLRMDVIWSKPNPMPESVTDRPTKSHEYLFQLTKSGDPTYWVNERRGTISAKEPKPDWWWRHSMTEQWLETEPEPEWWWKHSKTGDWSEIEVPGEDWKRVDAWKRINAWSGRDYFYDREATLEPYGTKASGNKERTFGDAVGAPGMHRGNAGRSVPWSPAPAEPDPNVLTLGDLPPEAPRGPDGRRVTTRTTGEGSHESHRSDVRKERWPAAGRNMRSVWDIPTISFKEAHFATFPEELARRCIIASCPELVCAECGKPRERLVEASGGTIGQGWHDHSVDMTNGQRAGAIVRQGFSTYARTAVGLAECDHDAYVPGVVLDPFMGAGTVALVARAQGRSTVGIELNRSYCELIARRVQQLSLLA